MKKKQTAVQWLQSQYDNCPESFLTDDDFAKALQMEREQMIEFAKFADRNLGYGVSFEDLYNQFINKCTPQS